MSRITREQLRERAREKVKSLEFSVTQTAFANSRAELEEELELSRIALASLEAEPVAYMYKDRLHTDARFSLHTRFGNWSQEDINEYEITEIPLYTAPPAPANAETVAWLWSHRKHPSEVSLVRPEDDERAEGAHWSGWSCQALYAAPPATESVPEWTNEQCLEFLSIAFRHAEIKGDLELDDIRLGVKMANGSRAAMLQGAENAESRCTIQTAPVLDSLPKIAESRCSNSPVIPDGLRLALSNAGIAAPESDEMLAATCEKYIQEMVTWVKERKPFQPAQLAPDGWVACSERMPESNKYVLVCNGVWVGMGLYNGGEQFEDCERWQDEHGEFIDLLHHPVSHWIPLPEAPQQEGE